MPRLGTEDANRGRVQSEMRERPYALRIHRPDLDVGARPVHCQSDPPDAGTKHLATKRGRAACRSSLHGTASSDLKVGRSVSEIVGPKGARYN
jgi:hypothetical protein